MSTTTASERKPSLARRPVVRRLGKYSLVSVVNVVLGETILAITFGLMGWSARSANLLATSIATVPSYFLNRAWVWGRTGRSRLFHEVLPFWTMAFVGLALSTLVAGHAEDLAVRLSGTRTVQTAIVMVSIFATFGVLWVARFVFLDTVLFADRRSPAGLSTEDDDVVI